jgi:hypothetical protein
MELCSNSRQGAGIRRGGVPLLRSLNLHRELAITLVARKFTQSPASVPGGVRELRSLQPPPGTRDHTRSSEIFNFLSNAKTAIY